MRKELVTPSVSLFIPAVTFLLFLLSGLGAFLQMGILPSSPQPAWLHIFVSHLRLLSKIAQIGMLCSVLNASLTLVWLFKTISPAEIGRCLTAIGTLFLLMGGVAAICTLSASAPRLYQALIIPGGSGHQMSMNALVQTYLLPVGIAILIFDLLGLVAWTALLSFNELCKRPPSADRPTPP